MHRRQAIREAAAAALVGLTANILEEQARRADVSGRPLVIVVARTETGEPEEGIMGDPEDRRALSLEFHVLAEAATGKACVDAVNDLDELIGASLAVANSPGGTLDPLVLDLRWASTTIEVNVDQELYLAYGIITYAATYDVFYGNPT